MVSATITIIENWFNEPTGDKDRPVLLSKLAIIELCGWIEGWMDDVVKSIDSASLKDIDWTRKNVIENTHGFHYEKHFRPMLCTILGEHKVREIERKYEAKHPGNLEGIKSSLGMLWTTRCKLAHADLVAHKAAQIKIDAPSWTKNQFRVLSKRLDEYKTVLLAEV